MTVGDVYDASVPVWPFELTSMRQIPRYKWVSVLPPSCGAESPSKIFSKPPTSDDPPPIVSSGRTCEAGPVFGCGSTPFGETPGPPCPEHRSEERRVGKE